MLQTATEGGFERQNVTFVTAFSDRDTSPFKKCVGLLVSDTFAWTVSKPDMILWLRGELYQTPAKFSHLLKLSQ